MNKTIMIFAAVVSLAFSGCNRKNTGRDDISPGVAIEQSAMSTLHERTVKAVTSAPPTATKGCGLVGTLGAARLKLLTAGKHEVFLPFPQLAETQVPICYAITTTPPESGRKYRLRKRDDSNVVVSVELDGKQGQEVRIDWSAVVLVADKPVPPGHSPSEPYLRRTSCVQADAGPIKTLADKLWPASGKIEDYAANIQEFIRQMQQKQPPRAMDAVGILEAGCNWICTANANLATALLRSKKIPARSIAVIPTLDRRLEMHRIVEYFDGRQWHKFDPSSLEKNIPMKPWQNIIMAWTTIADEDSAMTPRMGISLGGPCGQELEFYDGGMSFVGQDFFWTQGQLLAQFEPSNEAIELAKTEWNAFLENGKFSRGQVEVAGVTSTVDFIKALRRHRE